MKFKIKALILICTLTIAMPALAQDNSSAALGRALGTLLGNIFGGNSSDSSGQGPAFNDNANSSFSNTPVQTSQDQPSVQTMNAFKERESTYIGRQENLCSDEKFKAFFSKSPCQTSDISITNIVDKTKVTLLQKKSIEALDAEYLDILKLRADNYRENIKPLSLGLALSNLIMQLRIDSQKLLMNLYQEKITWGQFNEARRDLMAVFKKNFDSLITSK